MSIIPDVNELREIAKNSPRVDGIFEFLMQERITILKNEMRSRIGLPQQAVNKDIIMSQVHEMNTVLENEGISFYVDENWNSVEAFLRMSLLEDIYSEFKMQKQA